MKRIVFAVARAWSLVERGAEYAIVALSLMMVAAAVAQVVARYVLNAPLTWSEELARYLFVWLAFMAAWLAWRRREHIGIDALTAAFPKPVRSAMQVLVEAAVVGFAILTMHWGIRLLEISANQSSAALGIPMQWVYLGYYAGMTLIAGETLVSWMRRLARMEQE